MFHHHAFSVQLDEFEALGAARARVTHRSSSRSRSSRRRRGVQADRQAFISSAGERQKRRELLPLPLRKRAAHDFIEIHYLIRFSAVFTLRFFLLQ